MALDANFSGSRQTIAARRWRTDRWSALEVLCVASYERAAHFFGPDARRSFTLPRPRRKNTLRAALLAGMVVLSCPGISQPEDATETSRQDPQRAGLVALGRSLFESTELSADGSISCSFCHKAAFGFSGDTALAVGLRGYTARRRAPALIGLAAARAFMWDGRAATLEAQVVIPLEGPEMRVDWARSMAALSSSPALQPKIRDAGFQHLDRAETLTALAAYVRSIDPGRTRFDRYYFDHDETALTEREQLGFRLFVRKGNCASCHLVGPDAAPFTDGAFHATGIVSPASQKASDRGRGEITGRSEDDFAFKTPSLRSVSLRPFLMHDGSVTSLREAVRHYDRIDQVRTLRLDSRLRPLSLTEAEIDAMIAFLKTLTP